MDSKIACLNKKKNNAYILLSFIVKKKEKVINVCVSLVVSRVWEAG